VVSLIASLLSTYQSSNVQAIVECHASKKRSTRRLCGLSSQATAVVNIIAVKIHSSEEEEKKEFITDEEKKTSETTGWSPKKITKTSVSRFASEPCILFLVTAKDENHLSRSSAWNRALSNLQKREGRKDEIETWQTQEYCGCHPWLECKVKTFAWLEFDLQY
jgi:hypothetical protein